jgi:hypothetical protein
MSEQDTLQVKLQQAKAAAQQPVRVTDVEFAVIMLRESFVAAQASDSLCPRLFCWRCSHPALQPILSAAVAGLFQNLFPAAPLAAGDDPEWFKQLKSVAGNNAKKHMKLSGPWDV